MDRAFVFSDNLVFDEVDRSMVDSFVLVLPLSLLFVLVVLTIAYRDVLDVALGLFGVLTVLVWTFGFVGWTGIEFNQVMVAVPVFLVGLSIDYAIHVFMRHREANDGGGETSRSSMGDALGGVGVALLWVTATTAAGFLSNLSSAIPPLVAFGVVGAFGIVAAMVVFTLFVPALKVELDEHLAAVGVDRQRRALGTGGGVVAATLDGGRRVAAVAPWAVVAVALILTAAGAAGAVQLDTSFEQRDMVAGDPPDWMADLPEPVAPGAYETADEMAYVDERFARPDARGRVLIRGTVARDDVPGRVASTVADAGHRVSIRTRSDGSPGVTSPVSVMREVAAVNATFNESFVAADTDGDGVPDRNVEALYDDLYAAAPDRAAEVIHRTPDGEYAAVQLVVRARGDAPPAAVTDDVRAMAERLDGGGLDATAAGQVVVVDSVEDELFATVVRSLLVTLATVFVFLMVGYRRTHGSASLGFVTLVPIVLAVPWILGTMSALEIPFNVLTGTIASLTVGLGVDYNVHVTERFVEEREAGADVPAALSRTVRGTGGALFGSALTTAGGFGVLGFALLPVLRQFAVVTALTIVYAFLGSVFLLPSLLVIWSRRAGLPVARGESSHDSPGTGRDSAFPAAGRRSTATGHGGDLHDRRVAYERLGLASEAAVVFATLQSFEGAGPARLADLTGLERSAVAGALEDLAWYGLVEPSRGDSGGYRPLAHEAAVAWLDPAFDADPSTDDGGGVPGEPTAPDIAETTAAD